MHVCGRGGGPVHSWGRSSAYSGMKSHDMRFASLLAGWAYSEELIRSLQQYKQRYTWLWVAVELDSSTHVLTLDQVRRGCGVVLVVGYWQGY